MSTYKELLETTKQSLNALVDRFDLDEEKLLEKVAELEDKIEQMKNEQNRPAWGNCRNGCEPSYLDADGYCSPGCHMGSSSRGLLYSVSQESPNPNEIDGLWRL